MLPEMFCSAEFQEWANLPKFGNERSMVPFHHFELIVASENLK